MNIELWKEVHAHVTSGRIKESVRYLEQGLSNCPSPRFKSLIGTSFSNRPKDVALHINKFIIDCEKTFRVKAVYLEMNGFDINPDRWFFDLFAYDSYTEDVEDLDWLSDWDSGEWPDLTLTGLEIVQEEFAWYTGHKSKGYEDSEAKIASEFALLLVMCKFAGLIEEAVKTGTVSKVVPILATAHDFDIIPRFAD